MFYPVFMEMRGVVFTPKPVVSPLLPSIVWGQGATVFVSSEVFYLRGHFYSDLGTHF